MTFVITLVTLLVERFFDWSHLRHWQWFYQYQHFLSQRIPSKSSNVIIAASIIPLMLAVLLIEYLLQSPVYGLLKFVFALLVLLFCLGPQNFWADSFASLNALVQGDKQLAAARLGLTIGGEIPNHQTLLKYIFIEANRRVFAVVFWFVVLGPAGALMYRTICLSAGASVTQAVPNAELIEPSRYWLTLADWIPVRLFTGLFALGGHFSRVITCWNQKLLLDANSNEILLAECGTAALGLQNEVELPTDGSAEKSAISMLDRTFVIMLVIIAILSIFI